VKVYEIWMRYGFELVTVSGEPIADWTMTAYGKTPTAFLRSDEAAVNLAGVVALRDAGAHFRDQLSQGTGSGAVAGRSFELDSADPRRGDGGVSCERQRILQGERTVAGDAKCRRWRRCCRPCSSGCVTSTVDEMVFNEPVEGIGDATVVILGRRHERLRDGVRFHRVHRRPHHVARDPSIEIIDELEFINSMYPWFEPRTAPLRPRTSNASCSSDRSRSSSRP
jgi:hypothetical protein